ncbi:MAG: hypothetical protein QHC90_17815 [Shinella sp.]|nr:hypothetical protein [Shinella sp.]
MGREELLKTIADFQKRTGIADSTIGILAMNDAKFVFSLRKGRRCYPETIQKVLSVLADHEKASDRFRTICTEDGVWIAHDRISGLAYSGRTAKRAEGNLRKALEERASA